ncbi:hypothetical protein BDF22DRAFT_695698 [Syncephalis plumigaleata]|nr:hypothetical protein BDF22DRAFT_695698 [Syncephalis plumigaleata]
MYQQVKRQRLLLIKDKSVVVKMPVSTIVVGRLPCYSWTIDGFIMATSKKKLRQLRKLEKAKELGINVDTAPSFVVKGSELRKSISIGDIRDLLLWCLADGVNPSWVFVKNKLNLQRVVVLMIPFLDSSILQHGYGLDHRPISMEEVVREASARCERDPSLPKGMFAYLPRLKEHFSHICPTRGPSGTFQLQSPLHALLRCPWTKEEAKRHKEHAKKFAEGSERVLTREDLVASIAELQQYEYPLPTSISGVALKEHWRETTCILKATTEEQMANVTNVTESIMYAIDCEMVMTAMGSQLARATLLNESGETIFDELVIQEHPVTDYLTQYSGMTAKKLQEARFTFKQVQEHIFNIIDGSNAILVGHSLENDLKALKLVHTRIIDTSIVFGHPSGPPFRWKLRMLASKYLDRQIQVSGTIDNGEPIGHDSAEDALACLDLVKLKLVKGFEFGRNNKGTTSIFERLERQTPPRIGAASDRASTRHLYSEAASFISCDTDDQVIDAILEQTKEHHLIIGKLHNLENHHNPTANKRSESQESPLKEMNLTMPPPPLEPNVELLTQLDEQVDRLARGLPAGTGLIVLSGQGDTRDATRLGIKRRRATEYEQQSSSSNDNTSRPKEFIFNDNDLQALKHATSKARMGIAMFTAR